MYICIFLRIVSKISSTNIYAYYMDFNLLALDKYLSDYKYHINTYIINADYIRMHQNKTNLLNFDHNNRITYKWLKFLEKVIKNF